jgi:G:T-mismatch repair DNA endonuclease (very short patch repair protein)
LLFRPQDSALTAVKLDGLKLKVLKRFQSDKAVVQAAVMQNYRAFEYASSSLRGDEEIVKEILSRQGLALQYVEKELLNDPDVVMTAVEQTWKAFEFASPEVQRDRNIVIKMLSQNGLQLERVSKDLQNDPEVVLVAIDADGESLEFASEELRSDADLCLAAIRESSFARLHCRYDFSRDETFLLALCSHEGYTTEELSKHCDDALLENDEFMHAAAWHFENRKKKKEYDGCGVADVDGGFESSGGEPISPVPMKETAFILKAATTQIVSVAVMMLILIPFYTIGFEWWGIGIGKFLNICFGSPKLDLDHAYSAL